MIIYKYLDQKGAKQTIQNNSVVLRRPDYFNDPFDCKFYSDEEEMSESFDLFLNYKVFEFFYKSMIKHPTKNNIRNKIMKQILITIAKDIKKTKAYVFQTSIDAFVSLGLKKLKKDKHSLKAEFNRMIKNIYRKIEKLVLASCFASKYDSILMWSHYANKHKGVCIEYEIDDKNFKPVFYSDSLPNFQLSRTLGIIFGHNFLGEDPDMEKEEYQFALQPLLTKSEEWNYEGEVRCIFSKNKPNDRIDDGVDNNGDVIKLLKMNVPIKRIYIGCKADNSFVSEIKSITNAPVIKMQMAESEYKIYASQNE